MGQRPRKSSLINYGPIAEKRVDAALSALAESGVIHFWFRADRTLDAEGVDHLCGITHPEFSVWVMQVTSGKNKRRTYYKKLTKGERLVTKKPYRRRGYYRYIPLLAVTRWVKDKTIQRKIRNISRTYKSIFKNKRCPEHLKSLLTAFLKAKGIVLPE